LEYEDAEGRGRWAAEMARAWPDTRSVFEEVRWVVYCSAYAIVDIGGNSTRDPSDFFSETFRVWSGIGCRGTPQLSGVLYVFGLGYVVQEQVALCTRGLFVWFGGIRALGGLIDGELSCCRSRCCVGIDSVIERVGHRITVLGDDLSPLG
jgi:hypothetical protein